MEYTPLSLNKKPLAVFISTLCFMNLAQANTVTSEERIPLEEINVVSSSESFSGDPLSGTAKINDIVVSKKALQTRSSTLGNALSSELSVHSNQFGGGASAPVIRGQEGVRLKILQNGSDVIDMSQLSPDHAIGVDSLLAERVEIVRGASTLLYATASPAGVVNVVDRRILTTMPKKGYEVEVDTRYNTNNHEQLVTTGMSASLGKHLAFRFEGLARNSKFYHVPSFQLDQSLNYVPDTQNKTKAGSYGLSLIGEQGYIGLAYNERREEYGIPGHNHQLDSCTAHITGARPEHNYYLELYPHLMSDEDLVNTHFHCYNHTSDVTHSHDHPYGHPHNHDLEGPLVNSHAKRYDIRAELKHPTSFLDKIKLSYSGTHYKHDERDGNIPINLFKNNGYNLRMELFHTPIQGLTGVWGVQYQTQTSSANIPRIPPCSLNGTDPCHKNNKRDPSKITEGARKHWALIENTQSQLSFFMVEQLRWQKFLFEVGLRTEKQNIAIDHDVKTLSEIKASEEGCSKDSFWNICRPGSYPAADLSTYHARANSYLGSISWDIMPNYLLSMTYSHNERHPTPMELYYHGNHIATVSFEHGNRYLKKEVSDNLELGLAYFGEKLSYTFNVYYNHFKNRIFNQTLTKSGNLTLNRYSQSKARYYGVEGRIDYEFYPHLTVGIFGDYVRGQLYKLPPTYFVEYLFQHRTPIPQADQNAPRVPPARLGLRANMQLIEHLEGTLEYTYVYQQNKVAPLENKTPAYSLLNVGLDYSHSIAGVDYQVFIQGNNLLNRHIYSHTSFLPFVPQMGRNITLGVNVRF